MAQVTLQMNRSALSRLLEGRNGPVTLSVANVGREARGKVKSCLPKVSGRLARSVEFRMARQTRGWTAEVFSREPYASWVEDGKRFDPRSGHEIYVKVGPRPCFRESLRSLSLSRSRRII